MCGFVGYAELTNSEAIKVSLVSKMNDTIIHRGPDGEGFAFLGNYNNEEVSKLKNERPEALVFNKIQKEL